MAAHLAGLTDPAEAVTEGIATAVERLPHDKHMSLLLGPERAGAFSVEITYDAALAFAGSMLRRFDVDWAAAGFDDADLDELAEYLLRIIQSFVVDPGRPQQRGAELRRYLRRWVGAAVARDSARAGAAGTESASRR